jgi:hypothetical protein
MLIEEYTESGHNFTRYIILSFKLLEGPWSHVTFLTKKKVKSRALKLVFRNSVSRF